MLRRRFLSNGLSLVSGAWLAPPLLRQAIAQPSAAVSTFAFIGDGGFSTEEDGALRSSLLKSNVTNLILGGDNRYDPSLSLEDTWDEWRREGFKFRMVTIGNHTPGYEEEVRYFGLPAEYYAVRDNGALYLILNSDDAETGPEQAAWLREQLVAANDQFIFLIYHHPAFNVSDFHHWEERGDFQNAVRPVIREFLPKITAIINGHEHLAGLYQADDVPLVVAGASIDTRGHAFETGAELDGIRFSTRWLYNGDPCWLRLDVNPSEGTAWMNFVDVKTGRVTCSADLAHRPFTPVVHPS